MFGESATNSGIILPPVLNISAADLSTVSTHNSTITAMKKAVSPFKFNEALKAYYDEAAKSVSREFESDLAKYLVVIKKGERVDPTQIESINVRIEVFADGSKFLLTGGTQFTREDGGQQYPFNTTACIHYIDRNGNEMEFPLSPIFEEALSMRVAYCTSLFAASRALKSTQSPTSSSGNVNADDSIVNAANSSISPRTAIRSITNVNSSLVNERISEEEEDEEEDEEEEVNNDVNSSKNSNVSDTSNSNNKNHQTFSNPYSSHYNPNGVVATASTLSGSNSSPQFSTFKINNDHQNVDNDKNDKESPVVAIHSTTTAIDEEPVMPPLPPKPAQTDTPGPQATSTNETKAENIISPTKLSAHAPHAEPKISTTIWFILSLVRNIFLTFGLAGLITIIAAILWLHISDGLIDVVNGGTNTDRITY